MHKRGAHIPGYSIERSTYESYLRNVGDTYFKQLNQIMTRDIIEKYKNGAIFFMHEFIIQPSIILKNIRFIVFFLLIYII